MIGMHGSTLCHLAMPCIIYENKLYRKCQRVADDAPYSFFFLCSPFARLLFALIKVSYIHPSLYHFISLSLSLLPSCTERYTISVPLTLSSTRQTTRLIHTYTSGWRCLPTHSWPRQALTRKSNPEA